MSRACRSLGTSTIPKDINIKASVRPFVGTYYKQSDFMTICCCAFIKSICSETKAAGTSLFSTRFGVMHVKHWNGLQKFIIFMHLAYDEKRFSLTAALLRCKRDRMLAVRDAGTFTCFAFCSMRADMCAKRFRLQKHAACPCATAQSDRLPISNRFSMHRAYVL